MRKREKQIHPEARRAAGTGYEWAVSDCYHTTPSVEMTTDWSRVTCKLCRKAKPKEKP